ncbi:hypothetical protein BV25DRAFT_1826628 [Artomyces pyxidatus]|uniref:Uncharacterized protein n=1 Tax=Artomyces pyxidatus TaxID=48021 RepID=A0ACB8SZ72_9AGAM|nr:hypothetical protein BV25DRAFT_1826628 [Artomyces pyxidatus]
MSLFTIFFIYLVAFVHAAPLVKRIVVSPHITSPSASTVWNVGDKVTVTWDTSTIPEPKNFTGSLVLGFETPNSENLDAANPLATGFLLTDGQVDITVPNVPSKTTYIVVLFGDSGNASPEFTITGGSVSPSTPITSGSAVTSPIAPPTSTASESSTTAPTSSTVPITTSAASPSTTVTSLPPSSSTAPPSSSSTSPSSTSVSSAPSSSVSPSASSSPQSGSANGALSRHVDALTMALCAGAAMALTFVL